MSVLNGTLKNIPHRSDCEKFPGANFFLAICATGVTLAREVRCGKRQGVHHERDSFSTRGTHIRVGPEADSLAKCIWMDGK